MSKSTDIAAAEPNKQAAVKRKRSTLPDEEIEVDVNLPEPPSKKALRRAKKLKISEKTTQAPKGAAKVKRKDRAEDHYEESEEEALPKTTETPKTTLSIWIGNLPFSLSKAALSKFLCDHSQPSISPSAISRMHMPVPTNARSTQVRLKPQNKGFAYVDFIDQQSFAAALALTETPLGGRNLLIKDAKNFEGRPEERRDTKDESKTTKALSGQTRPQTSHRVFVGNLGFDVTNEDLSEFYAPCGEVTNIHMATFEDTGKCKGFAWVTFADTSAAEAAVRGWTKIPDKTAATEEEPQPDEQANGDTEAADKPKKMAMRKWFVNRLQGRTVRCEFAEDPTARYKKRFGRDSRAKEAHMADNEEGPTPVSSKAPTGADIVRNQHGIAPGAPSDATMRRGRNSKDSKPAKEDQANLKISALPADVKYRTGGITASTGSRKTFD